MDVFDFRNRVVEDYGAYVRSFITIRDERVHQKVKEEMEGGFLWPAPLVQLNPSFQDGDRLKNLVAEGLLHPECLKIFRAKQEDGASGPPFQLYQHQVEGIRAAAAGDNYVLTTGTGSGKSLAYIVPIVDHVMRRGSGRGIQAIIVYPMNALANSQIGELEKFLHRGYPEGQPPVTFARYTGQESAERRAEIIKDPLDILLTNYVMLELVLTRFGHNEEQLVSASQGLRFLVLDELHTYRGRQGADVAMLVRRARRACRADRLIHIGTSATLSSGGPWPQQQAEVARVASGLFGAEVKPDRVIGETLRRATKEADLTDPSFRVALADRVRSGTAPSVLQDFLADPLSSWIESTPPIGCSASGA
ncbi:DEAD/DEAH box helicase [Candidatus Palauibacter sp.]|uniref:DEAD/DEAH box helicase n=1 Tax=Candidatus Palauibacter sp. TaxID=3101350 RepID=UPI003B5CC0C9